MTTKSDSSSQDQEQGLYKGSFRDSINRKFKNFRASSLQGGSRPSSKDVNGNANKSSGFSSKFARSTESLLGTSKKFNGEGNNSNGTMTSRLDNTINKSNSDLNASSNNGTKNHYAEPELPPLTPLSLTGYKSTTKSRLLTIELAEDIRNLISSRLQLYNEWKLLYSLEQHGASLNTLYQRCSPDFERPSNNIHTLNQTYTYSTNYSPLVSSHHKKLGYVLIFKDFKGNIFGAFTNEHFHPSDNSRFYGNGECFLWKTKHNNCFSINKSKDTNKIERTMSKTSSRDVEFENSITEPTNVYDNHALKEDDEQQQPHDGTTDKDSGDSSDSVNNSTFKHSDESGQFEHHLQFFAYPYTGLNDFIIYCTKDFLSLGVGEGHYGLWADNDLMNGLSYRSLTFGNEPLSDAGSKFKIHNVEVWKIGN